MPLRPPRPGKTPNYEIRGTYLGVAVERSAGTPDKKIAQRQLREIMRAIEHGEFGQQAVVAPAEPTFLIAAVAYLKAGGEGKYLGPILEMTGAHALRDLMLDEIDQIKIDNAASALYPSATPQTLNRQFYTPVSAVLKRVGVEARINRPKGWRGHKARSWLEPVQAFALLASAYALDPEFGLLCTILLYTGMRISEALRAKLRHLDLEDKKRRSKNCVFAAGGRQRLSGHATASGATYEVDSRSSVNARRTRPRPDRRRPPFPQARFGRQAVSFLPKRPSAQATCRRYA